MKIDILGTEYSIIKKAYDVEPEFKERNICGYCDGLIKEIVYCDMATHPNWGKESEVRVGILEKETVRHEIVHAFLNESGLQESALMFEGAWPKNEEMVDWFVLQGPKIYKAWQEAGAL